MSMRVLFVGLALVVAVLPGLASEPWPTQEFSQNSLGQLSSSAPPRADVTVGISGPVGVYVDAPGTYSVLVSNIGRRVAASVRLTIALPRTHTSPTVHVLGNLVAQDGRCTRVGTTLDCTLGSMNRGTSTPVTFTIELPQSSAALVVDASVTTTSTETTTANNSDSDTAYLLHPPTAVSAGDAAHVEHCTGTNLTSFFECELYPSSISSHDIEFLSGGIVAFVGAPPSYHGTWDQSAGTDRLLLKYYDGVSLEATFDGYAVGNDCFEGVTVFPSSIYVAPYRVCLQ